MKTVDLKEDRARRRREDCKECIFQAAESVILRKGYNAMTMEDVAKEAQFSKATLYQYFHSKAELIKQILLHYYDDVKRIFETIRDADVSAKEKLRRVIHSTIDFYEEKENLSRAILMDDSLRSLFDHFAGSESQARSSREKKFIETWKEKYNGVIEEGEHIIRDGVQKGELRRVDVRAATYFVNAVLMGALHIKSWADHRQEVAKEAELLFEFLWKGLAGPARSEKGELS